MKKRRSMSVSNIIRLLFFPTILLLTILAGIRVRGDLNNIITHGFDKKLSAVSSTTGAFVDLEDHKLIFTPRTMTALDVNNNADIFAVTGDSDITQLSTDGSASLSPIFKSGVSSRHLAISDESIFVSDSAGTRLFRYSLEGEPETEPELELEEFTFSALTYHDPSETLFLINSYGELLQVNPDNGLAGTNSTEVISTGITDVIDITESPDGGLTLLTADQTLYTLNINGEITGKVSGDVGDEISGNSETDSGAAINGNSEVASGAAGSGTILSCLSEEEPNAPCPHLGNLAFDADKGHYWAVGERLYKVLDDGTIDLDYYTYPGYYDHWSPYYLKYSGAMRNILADQELTYLYSFTLFPEDGSIAYVLDGSVDEDYTHIGYMDYELPPADFDQATFVLQTGRNHVSDIHPWGQWGLLKYGFAPIYDSELQADAVMGADLNVSAISQVTREAMVILSLSTFFFLILSGFAAWYISRPLIAPLVKLKENVLHIAAGFFDKPIDAPPLKDLRPLAGLFNETGDKLNHEIYESVSAKQKFEQNRRFYELLTTFKDQMDGFHTDDIACTILDRPADSTGLAGACYTEGYAAVWRLKPSGDPLETLRRHQEVKVLVKALSKRSGTHEAGQIQSGQSQAEPKQTVSNESGSNPSESNSSTVTTTTLAAQTEAMMGGYAESIFLWHKEEQNLVYRTVSEEILQLKTATGMEKKRMAGTGTIPVSPDVCAGWRLHLTDSDGTRLTIGTPEEEST